jgi:hypothetical protein
MANFLPNAVRRQLFGWRKKFDEIDRSKKSCCAKKIRKEEEMAKKRKERENKQNFFFGAKKTGPILFHLCNMKGRKTRRSLSFFC